MPVASRHNCCTPLRLSFSSSTDSGAVSETAIAHQACNGAVSQMVSVQGLNRPMRGVSGRQKTKQALMRPEKAELSSKKQRILGRQPTCQQVQIGAVPLVKEQEVPLPLHNDVPGVYRSSCTHEGGDERVCGKHPANTLLCQIPERGESIL